MADQAHRRTAKPFEPPPWEKEQFEEFAREREREQAAEAAAAAAAEAAERDEAQEQSQMLDELAAHVVAEDVTRPEAVQDTGGRDEQEAAEPDAARVDTMLIMLKAEEPDAVSGMWKVGMAAGLFLATMGLVLVVWSGVALARTLEAGPAAYLGAGIMGLMGAGLVALGVWLVVRSLRKQGVL